MPSLMKANVVYSHKMTFSAKAMSGDSITLDYVPPLGDAKGFMPLELLLVSLAGCSGATVASLLRKFGNPDFKMEVSAEGERVDTHPTVFSRIKLEFKVSGNNLPKETVEKAVKMSEDKFCPVWAMLKPGVKIETNIKITQI